MSKYCKFCEFLWIGGIMIDYRWNLVTLAIIGYLDFKQGRIPNAILLGWIATIITVFSIVGTPLNPSSIAASLITVGIYYPLRQMVKCCAGDFKLYAVMMLSLEPKDSLCICFISMLISLYPLASGNRYVPLGLMTFFGYITFLLLRLGEIIWKK